MTRNNLLICFWWNFINSLIELLSQWAWYQILPDTSLSYVLLLNCILKKHLNIFYHINSNFFIILVHTKITILTTEHYNLTFWLYSGCKSAKVVTCSELLYSAYTHQNLNKKYTYMYIYKICRIKHEISTRLSQKIFIITNLKFFYLIMNSKFPRTAVVPSGVCDKITRTIWIYRYI